MLIEQLKDIVGENNWLTDDKDTAALLTDWRGRYTGKTPVIVFPRSAKQVSRVVSACAEANTSIVPQGGNTGLCGGSIPDASGTEVVLSLSKMNTIRDIDAENYSMEVEAGCILQNVQQAARDVDRLFALSLGAEGSCQIGGNLSTNAGGINVVRYGTARAQVLGLEVVLADGEIITDLRSLRKDTGGYDLKQLFVGSEGTLGIITAATLRLFPLPMGSKTALVAVSSADKAVQLLSRLRSALSDSIESFELISDFVFSLVEQHLEDTRNPFDERSPWYVLLEAPIRDEHDEERLLSGLNAAIEDKIASDAIIAKNQSEADRLWQMRHSIAEAEKRHGMAQKHDISLPISKLGAFLRRGDELLHRNFPNATLIAFGHVGDGNLHYNVALPPDSVEGERVSEQIYGLVDEFGGSFSAEHGVGIMKRNYLTKYRSAGEISLMRTLKRALDPRNILNPGKVI